MESPGPHAENFDRLVEWLHFELAGRGRSGGGGTRELGSEDRNTRRIKHFEPAKLHVEIIVRNLFQ